MTLIELMIVVAIIGVIAVLASVGYARWARSAKMAEGTNMVASIKNAQENYFSQTGRYLDVSNGLDLGNLHPAANPGPSKVAWTDACSVCKAGTDWRRLGIKADAPVYFGYAAVADEAQDPGGKGVSVKTDNFGTIDWDKENGGVKINKPWYIVRAMADTDGNKKYAQVIASSLSSRVIVDNEGE